MKKVKGWKTITFNIIMTATMILSLWSPEEASNIPGADAVNEVLNEAEKLIATIWGMGNVVLRAVTTTPLGKSE